MLLKSGAYPGLNVRGEHNIAVWSGACCEIFLGKSANIFACRHYLRFGCKYYGLLSKKYTLKSVGITSSFG